MSQFLVRVKLGSKIFVSEPLRRLVRILSYARKNNFEFLILLFTVEYSNTCAPSVIFQILGKYFSSVSVVSPGMMSDGLRISASLRAFS